VFELGFPYSEVRPLVTRGIDDVDPDARGPEQLLAIWEVATCNVREMVRVGQLVKEPSGWRYDADAGERVVH
jgi:hypothetical protein